MITVDTLTGLAELIAGAGLGVWSPGGVYAAGDTGIVLGRLPQSPLRAIGLTPYAVPGTWPVTIQGVQIRMRSASADLRPLADLQEALLVLLDYRGLTILAGHPVSDMWRQSSTPVGALGSVDLPEVADSYYLLTDR